MRQDILSVQSLYKQFGAVRANDDVTIHVERGSIHAILGENGAGKSTLVSMLYGLLQPDAGKIVFDGVEVSIESPRKAMTLGIGMVHQHFMLVEPLTVTENVVLGLPGSWRLNLKQHAARLAALSEEFGFDVDPEATIAGMPIGMQQRVEILKCLYRDADLLILDEPTSVLTPVETASFFEVLRKLRASGKTIILITHKLEEVMALSDRVTVMRLGKVTDEVVTQDTTARHLARLMVGRDVVFKIDESARTAIVAGKPPLLTFRNVRARNDRGYDGLSDMSFEVAPGEILGFAGVDGNGQAELAEVLAGLRPYAAGEIKLDNKDLSDYSVSDRIHTLKIGFVPEDRHRTGLVLDYSVADNMVLRNFYKKPVKGPMGILNRRYISEFAEEHVVKYQVKADGIHQAVRRLSGGNQQKVILAREIEAGPHLLVVSQPCKGLDVGAIEFVQNTLIAERNKGVAIIYISTELEHILAICDRVAVLYKGTISGYVVPGETSNEEIGKLMAGFREADSNAA